MTIGRSSGRRTAGAGETAGAARAGAAGADGLGVANGPWKAGDEAAA